MNNCYTVVAYKPEGRIFGVPQESKHELHYFSEELYGDERAFDLAVKTAAVFYAHNFQTALGEPEWQVYVLFDGAVSGDEEGEEFEELARNHASQKLMGDTAERDKDREEFYRIKAKYRW